ncbi:MAG: hypothetical protein Kow0047_32570 [Anaerolineae bacterium]
MTRQVFRGLPRPKVFEWLDGRFTWEGVEALVVSVAGDARVVAWAEEFSRDLAPRLGRRLVVNPVRAVEPGVWLAASTEADLSVARLHPPESPQGYVLRASPGLMAIAARRPVGLLYGLQTLRQAMEDLAAEDASLPAFSIVDWPDLRLRGVHWDLKGAMAPFEYWREALVTLARYKVNCLLIEYEDKFPYQSHPDIVHPDAWSPEQVAELNELARHYGMEVIPLVQCLGHVEYILRHPQYASLREAGDLSQYCPLQPDALALFRELADEVMAAHPHSQYFHLGADETWVLGRCPRCREVVAERGKLGLYLDYVVPAIRHVQARGRTPIIWADMVWRTPQPDRLSELPTGTVLCDWLYHVTEPRSTSFPWGDEQDMGRRWASRRWLELDPDRFPVNARPLEELPPQGEAFARKYWDQGEWPLWGDSFPYVNFFREQGWAVLGASAAKGADGFAAFCPNFERRYANIVTWASAAAEKGLLGVISTAWARYATLTVPCEPFEMAWYTYLASAEAYWNGGRTAQRVFDAAFDRRLGGREGFAQAIHHLDRGRANAQGSTLSLAREELRSLVDQFSGPAQRYARHLWLAAALAELQQRAKSVLERLTWIHGRLNRGELTREAERARHEIEALLAELASWRAEAGGVMRDSLLPADLDEVVETQIAGLEHALREWQSRLGQHRGG